MEVNSLKIARVFSSGGDIHYILPVFQREYTWEKSNWETLLSDVFAIYSEYVEERVPEHFMGSLVVVEDGQRHGVIPAFRLVDGQQRLTTISLLLCALGRIVKASHPALSNKINRHLLNVDESGEVHYKLYPTTKYGDRACYTALLDGIEAPVNESRIAVAYQYLYRELERKITSKEIDPEQLFKVVTTSLQVVLITLNSGESPYQIFESLNAKGKPLSQADLVRNYIAMKVAALDQEELYKKHWVHIETLLQEQRFVGRSGLGELTAFLRHYGAMHSGVLANQAHVYARFRDRIESQFKRPAEIVTELENLHRFARYYAVFLRPETESDPAVRTAIERLNTMDASTAYPFLLALFDAHEMGSISRENLLEALSCLENYLVRRYLTGESTNYLTKMFPLLWKVLNPEDFVASLQAALAVRSYPSDSKIRQAVKTREFYENKSGSREKLVLVLRSINHYLGRSEDVVQELRGPATIEHVLPQTPPDDWRTKWKEELGPDWQQFYEDYQAWKAELGEDWESTYSNSLHTLGNLTLVTQLWQMKLSNKPFVIKKDLLVGQGLHLNMYFGKDIARWDETAIEQRALNLVEDILQIWPSFIVGIPDSVTSTERRDWDEQSTFAMLRRLNGEDAEHVAQKVLAWAQSRQLKIWWSRNSTIGSFVPTFQHNGQDYQLFVVRASGEIELYFYWYQYKRPFDVPEQRLELLKRLNAIAGIILPESAIGKRPTFAIKVLENEAALGQFLEIFDWFIDQVASIEPALPSIGEGMPERETSAALQLAYWTAFAEYLRQSHSSLPPKTPRPQRWMSFAIGRSYFETATEISISEKNIAVTLLIFGPKRFEYFRQLVEHKASIEAELKLTPETQMIWGELPDNKICRIQIIWPQVDATNREQWPEQHEWLRERLEALLKAFTPRVKSVQE